MDVILEHLLVSKVKASPYHATGGDIAGRLSIGYGSLPMGKL
jgi:hypothetical protein